MTLEEKYQEKFNNRLREIRRICKISNNSQFADAIVGIMFDFSDDLKEIGLIEGQDKNEKQSNEQLSL